MRRSETPRQESAVSSATRWVGVEGSSVMADSVPEASSWRLASGFVQRARSTRLSDNARRLRRLGFALLAMELIAALARSGIFHEAPEAWALPSTNPTVWISIAVVFVLAEIFAEGARLRRQAELTI